MKPHFSLQISILSVFLLLQMSHFAKADISGSQSLFGISPVICEYAASMNCQVDDYLSSYFLDEGTAPVISQGSCVKAKEVGPMSEYWLSISLSGSNIYYLDGYGVNAGMEIYTGSCGSLVMVDCESATGDDSFIGFLPPVSDHYYVRLLGYNLPGRDYFEVLLNYGFPGPACAISIDHVEVGTCVSDSGTVSMFMSGSVNPVPSIPIFYAEVVTDMGYYAFSGESVDGLWEAAFEVSGSLVYYVAVFGGNSETGCSDSRAGTALPTILCDSLSTSSYTGSVDWLENCGRRNGEMKLYQTGTDIFLQSYLVIVGSNGLFGFENPPPGNYDIILKVDGYLSKGFSNIEIPLAGNLLECGSLSHGDLNGDGVVDIIDLSLILSLFGAILPAIIL